MLMLKRRRLSLILSALLVLSTCAPTSELASAPAGPALPGACTPGVPTTGSDRAALQSEGLTEGLLPSGATLGLTPAANPRDLAAAPPGPALAERLPDEASPALVDPPGLTAGIDPLP